MNAGLPHARLFGSQQAFHIDQEVAGDMPERERLLDRVMGPERFGKGSERLRRGRSPSHGLSFVASNSHALIGTVRLWDVTADDIRGCAVPMLMLGPLAVDTSHAGSGVGSALVRHAIGAASSMGHGAIALVGDPEYYGRFGFDAVTAARISMPGQFERRRMLGIELIPGWLDAAHGMLSVFAPDMQLAA